MIVEQKNQVRLKINLDGGLDGDKQIIKSKTYSRIDNAAAPEGLHTAATAMAAMQELPLLSVVRLDEVVLVDDNA